MPIQQPNALEAHMVIPYGLKLAYRRDLLGVTRAQLAERAGMTVEDVATLEASFFIPDAGTVQRLARALDVPVAVLVADAIPD